MPSRPLRLTFYVAAAITLALTICLAWIDQHLTNSMAPKGIISLELARNPGTAHAIIESWGAEGLGYAHWSMLLDYPFLIGYVTVFVCLTLFTRTPASGLISAGFVLAGLADLVENLFLHRLLAGEINATFTELAFTCASVKFGLLTVGWLYLLSCGLYALYLSLRQRWQDS